jgi:hypothetical protein
MLACLSNTAKEATRVLQQNPFAQILQEEVLYRCHCEKRSMFLRQLRTRMVTVTVEYNVYFCELSSGNGEEQRLVPTEAFFNQNLKAVYIEDESGGSDYAVRVVLVFNRRVGLGYRPVVFHVGEHEQARLDPILEVMCQMQSCKVQRLLSRKGGSTGTQRSVSLSTDASDGEEYEYEMESDDNSSDDGFAPQTPKKVHVRIGPVQLGVPARLPLDEACNVCNFLAGFEVSNDEFQKFAHCLARKKRILMKNGQVSARGLTVISRSLPDLMTFRREQEELEIRRLQSEEHDLVQRRTQARRDAKKLVTLLVGFAVGQGYELSVHRQ